MTKMSSSLLAQRYAKALFELHRDAGHDLVSLKNTLGVLAGMADDWQKLASSPTITAMDKKSVVAKIMASLSGEKKMIEKFLNFLVDKKRLGLFSAIAQNTIDLIMKEQGQYVADIKSATELTPEQKTDLEKILSTQLPNLLFDAKAKTDKEKVDKNMITCYSIDETLLGGFTVAVGSYYLDLSVKSKLKNLSGKLQDYPTSITNK